MAEELFCICRKPYNEGDLMIGCDKCGDWFHFACIGIKEHHEDSIKDYVCQKCSPKGIQSVELKPGIKVTSDLAPFVPELKSKAKIVPKRALNPSNASKFEAASEISSSGGMKRRRAAVDTRKKNEGEQARLRVRIKLAEILSEGDQSAVAEIAEEIETEVYLLLGNSNKYLQKIRDLLQNLKRNRELRSRVQRCDVSPKNLVNMRKEELASESIKREVSELKKKAMGVVIKEGSEEIGMAVDVPQTEAKKDVSISSLPGVESPAASSVDKIGEAEANRHHTQHSEMKTVVVGHSELKTEAFEEQQPIWRGKLGGSKSSASTVSLFQLSGTKPDVKMFPSQFYSIGTLVDSSLNKFLKELLTSKSRRSITLLKVEAQTDEGKYNLSELSTKLKSMERSGVMVRGKHLEIYYIPPNSRVTQDIWKKKYPHATICCITRREEKLEMNLVEGTKSHLESHKKNSAVTKRVYSFIDQIISEEQNSYDFP